MNPLQKALNDYIAIRRSLGFQLRLPAKLFTELCWVSTTQGSFTHHHGTGASLGHGAGNGSAFDLGRAFGNGAALRRLA